jgi:peptide/nickel transport system permease protein
VGIGDQPAQVRIPPLVLREQEFVRAALALGASRWRIVLRHLAPNFVAPTLVLGSYYVAITIIAEAGTSFIGVGAQPPTPEWGAMMTDARSFLQDFWWYPTFPGLALALTVVGFNLLGDGLRDWLDSRLRGSLRAGRW